MIPIKINELLLQEFNKLKNTLGELNKVLNPDGSIPNNNNTTQYFENIINSLNQLSPYFIHHKAYYQSLVKDFQLWEKSKGIPNFEKSLNNYNPQTFIKTKEIEICIFPMYTPNNSMNITCEAIFFKYQYTKEFILYENYFKNKNFIPAYLIDATEGFNSECVVLFPEMIMQGENKINNFGILFSNREAKRFSFYIKNSIKLLNININEKQHQFIDNQQEVNQAFMLWDLIHDANHFKGYLPFDKFMMKKKSPYWMYAIEELRVDLDTYIKITNIKINNKISKNIKFTLLFDRLFRFPISGSEEKNYDGLAGQIIFGYLYKNSILEWNNLKLSFKWDDLNIHLNNLSNEIHLLYKDGVNQSRERFWINTYKLIRKYCSPNISSTLNYKISKNKDIQSIYTEILDNEFPLNQFYKYLSKHIDKNWL